MLDNKIVAVDLDGVLGSHLSALFRFIKPIPGAIKSIETLKQNHQLKIVTARYPLFRKSSIKWVNQYFPDCFNSIEFVKYKTPFGPRTSKANICKRINASIIIDDKLKNVLDCSKAGIKVYYFGARPDNQTKDLLDNVILVEDWSELLENLS